MQRIYSWNGEKYDMPTILPALVSFWASKIKYLRDIKCIKRKTGYMELRFRDLVFRDFMNYSCPMSLDAFAKSCGITVGTLQYEVVFINLTIETVIPKSFHSRSPRAFIHTRNTNRQTSWKTPRSFLSTKTSNRRSEKVFAKNIWTNYKMCGKNTALTSIHLTWVRFAEYSPFRTISETPVWLSKRVKLFTPETTTKN